MYKKDDLRGYTQCHFFAGIGGWSLALKLAGWPEDRPVWTGSCPCQPYSTAGKQRGNADERDLWPAFFRLIAECRPEFVFGEQVENAIRHGWLDRVYADLEREEYAVGAAVLGAHSVGAPHRRYRLYWGGVRVADSESERFKKGVAHFHESEKRPSVGREFISMAYPDEPVTCLIDYHNNVTVDAVTLAKHLGHKLKAIRVDTSKSLIDHYFDDKDTTGFDPHGVCKQLIYALRKALDDNGFQFVQIVVSSGFTPEKIDEWTKEGVPVDMYGIGTYLVNNATCGFTGDLVELDGHPEAKEGRRNIPSSRLEKVDLMSL